MGDSQNEMQVLYGQIIGKYRKPRTKWWFLWENIIYILNGDCRLSCLITAWYPQFRHFYNEKTNHWIWGYLSGKPKWLRTSNISAIEISAIVCCTALSSPLPKVKERRDLVFTLAERGGIALSQRYILLCFPLQYAFEMLGWFWWITLEVNLGFDTLWWKQTVSVLIPPFSQPFVIFAIDFPQVVCSCEDGEES